MDIYDTITTEILILQEYLSNPDFLYHYFAQNINYI